MPQKQLVLALKWGTAHQLITNWDRWVLSMLSPFKRYLFHKEGAIEIS